MVMQKPARKWFEYLLVLAVIIVVSFLVGSNVYYQQRAGKQRVMFYQLQILRSAINLFKVVNKAAPHSLVELAVGYYKFPGEGLTKRYIENPPIDEKGRVVDPFGNPYYYDSKTGWIRCATQGYEFW